MASIHRLSNVAPYCCLHHFYQYFLLEYALHHMHRSPNFGAKKYLSLTMFLRGAILKFILVVLLVCPAVHATAQLVRFTEDTAKVSFGLYAKAGIIYDYPFFDNYSDIGPIGEIGTNIVLNKFQIGVGIGYFPNNSHWNQGADIYNPAKRGTTQTGAVYFPLHVNFKFFHIKRNILSMKLGFIFLASTKQHVSETSIYSTYETTMSYDVFQSRFGLAATMGIKYSRFIGNHLLIGAELDLNLALISTQLLGTDYTYGYNMANRHPNADFKLCFEYIFGKKHINYLDETKRKKRKAIEDEE